MTRQMQNARVWALVVAMAGMAATAAAQQPAAPAGPAGTVQIPAIETYEIGKAKPPVDPGAAVKDLSLDQAIQIALENNLDLKVAKMNPQIQDYNLLSARATFKPTFAGTFNQSHSSTLSTSLLDAVASNRITQQQTYGTTLSQNLSMWGANYSIAYNTGRASDNSANTTRPIQYTGSTRLSYSQPLLANFKIDNARNNIRVQQVQKQIVDIQLIQTIENTKGSVRTAYWALRRAIEQVEIQRLTLDLSQRLYDDNKTKVTIGTMAPIDIVQNESTVASNKQALLNARIAWQTAELSLKRLLVGGTDDALYGMTINPTEQAPVLQQVAVDIPKAVQTALQERTDITQTKKTLESSAFTVELRKNATLPSLSASASYTLAGTGGNLFDKNGVLTQQSGYGDVLSGIGKLDQPTWTLGMTFTYPLGMVASRAALAQAQITYEQSKANLKVLELTVATDVTSAGLAVQNTYEQLLAARVARDAADRTYAAEQTRFDVGMSNNFNVAQTLNDLTSKRLSELNALIAYVNAIADYERKQRIGGSGATAVAPSGGN